MLMVWQHKEFEPGEEVQFINPDDSAKDGVVISTLPAKRERPEEYWKCTNEEIEEMSPTAFVKWSDGTESTVNTDYLQEKESDFEREFRNIAVKTYEEINGHVCDAYESLRKAIEISDRTGIPLNSSVSFLGQSYFPKSFEEKFKDIDSQLVESITGASNEYGGSGWEHSDIC